VYNIHSDPSGMVGSSPKSSEEKEGGVNVQVVVSSSS